MKRTNRSFALSLSKKEQFAQKTNSEFPTLILHNKMLQENKNKKIIEALPVLSFQAFLSEVIYTPQPVHQLSEIQEFGENYKNNPKN